MYKHFGWTGRDREADGLGRQIEENRWTEASRRNINIKCNINVKF